MPLGGARALRNTRTKQRGSRNWHKGHGNATSLSPRTKALQVPTFDGCIAVVDKIPYFKGAVGSKAKFHVTVPPQFRCLDQLRDAFTPSIG